MDDNANKSGMSRRELLGTMGKAAAASVALPPVVRDALVISGAAALTGVAGVDRVVVLPGKTYLNGWAGYGDPPRQERGRGARATPPPENTGPSPVVAWSKVSGPGKVTFADAKAAVTTATFSAPGSYIL